eukprot:CAMPEP_0116871926 /NCGR_PEP_ID=MMETSP0463-20121206/2491_1 /TAXON_ID=181622 /ORGANISM="Strombidinopsis sp, Strain SopsisLIS2011" /LENGTH=39 /DNA_ID= /DNA_START= /DNA_END= /DNA_ORIENTATION=
MQSERMQAQQMSKKMENYDEMKKKCSTQSKDIQKMKETI